MKVLITFLIAVSCAYASDIYEYAPPAHQQIAVAAPHAQQIVEVAPPTVAKEVRVNTGVSSQSRAQDNQGNYAFSYKEDHSEGGTFRKESGNALGQVIGSYGLRTAEGLVRIVNYVADDQHGFRASIATNEPGTAAQAPAATSISSPHVVAKGPTVVHAAPAHQIAVETHGQVAEQLIASPHAQQIAVSAPVEAHGPIAHGPIAHGPVGHGPIAHGPSLVEAPAQLIKTYATSIYGPSLLTDNILFGKAPIPREIASYVPPLNSPEANGVPVALQAHDGRGYYEPTLVYSSPSGIGYVLGTNVGQFGYQLTYRKKKK